MTQSKSKHPGPGHNQPFRKSDQLSDEVRRSGPFRFIKSATELAGCPQDGVSEIALIGRSNAGKSTLINLLANSKIAKVSGSPGKTTLLNFFESKRYRLVDMPGYGFAKRSAEERDSWRGMIEPFLGSRANLVGLLLIMDIRRDWSQDEEQMVQWIEERDLPVAIVATKSDKLSRNEMLNRKRILQKDADIQDVFLTSSLDKKGFHELEDFIFTSWVKPGRGET